MGRSFSFICDAGHQWPFTFPCQPPPTPGSLVIFAAAGAISVTALFCVNRSLKLAPASVVVPVDKLSILVSVAFSVLVLRERVGARALVGLAVLVAGTVALAV